MARTCDDDGLGAGEGFQHSQQSGERGGVAVQLVLPRAAAPHEALHPQLRRLQRLPHVPCQPAPTPALQSGTPSASLQHFGSVSGGSETCITADSPKLELIFTHQVDTSISDIGDRAALRCIWWQRGGTNGVHEPLGWLITSRAATPLHQEDLSVRVGGGSRGEGLGGGGEGGPRAGGQGGGGGG